MSDDSDQYVRCSKQWQRDKLVDVLCHSGAYEKVFWWFLDLIQFASNLTSNACKET